MKTIFHLYFEIKLFLFLRNRKAIDFDPVGTPDENYYILWFGVRDRVIFCLEKGRIIDCLFRIEHDRWQSNKTLSKVNSNIIARKINDWRREQITSLN